MRAAFIAAIVAVFVGVVARSAAAEPIPSSPELPSPLSLDDAVRIFKTRGLDLLIADANTKSAEGMVTSAGAVANPVVNPAVGNAITYADTAYGRANCLQNGAVCTPWVFNLGISDSAALADWMSGKRDLRLKVARNALAAAKLSRADAERTLTFQVKAAYVQVAQAALAYKFAKDVAETETTTLRKFQDRYTRGAIHEGDLQRIEVNKLEAEHARDGAEVTLRSARLDLALLVGVRGTVPDFEVDTKVLDFHVPLALQSPTEPALMRLAFDHRPDLRSLGYLRTSADAQVALVRRQRFPDVQLGANYQWGGYGGLSTNGPVGQQVLTFGLTFPLPVFSQLEGELRQAEARQDTMALAHAKGTAQVANDVASGVAALLGARKQVERMEGPRRDGGGILTSAKGAFEILALQYEKGAASLTDYLDALRTYIATKNEYFQDLANYWTAVYQLEAAVAVELR